MITISGPRQSGRTTALAILAAMDSSGVLFVESVDQASRLVKDLPVLKGRVFSTRQILNGVTRGRHFERVYIDNADLLKPEEWRQFMLVLRPCTTKIQAVTAETGSNVEDYFRP